MSRILLVEDDEGARGLMTEWLRIEGFDIVHAADAETALELARLRSPDMFIADIFLPGMRGTDLCRTVRADRALRECYFILITGMDAPDTQLEGFRAGADDYIPKPIRREELLARVQIAGRIRQLQAAVRSFAARARATERAQEALLSLLEAQAQRVAEVQRRLDALDAPSLVELLARAREDLERVRERHRPAPAEPTPSPDL